MPTAEPERKTAFAVWLTGLPASGKTTVAEALARALSALGVTAAVLDSDSLRKVLTPRPRYDEEEREIFYGTMTYIGRLLTQHGVSVIFAATAHRRAYRDRARRQIPAFLEVFVDCPLAVCMARDPKGIYQRAQAGKAATVPGLQTPYEPPEHPEVIVPGDAQTPEAAAERILDALRRLGYLGT